MFVTGHWYSPMSDWQAPRDLLDFIGDEPPIYAGFGSPSAFVRARALQALIEAVAGRRVVFSPGWSNIDRSVLPENSFIARDVPHEWLFPRVSVAIHHGGAGTTHTAARAMRGAGPKAPRGAGMNAKAIAKLIAAAEQGSMREKARELGQAMARENGVGRAVREVESLVERGRTR